MTILALLFVTIKDISFKASLKDNLLKSGIMFVSFPSILGIKDKNSFVFIVFISSSPSPKYGII